MIPGVGEGVLAFVSVKRVLSLPANVYRLADPSWKSLLFSRHHIGVLPVYHVIVLLAVVCEC